MRKKKKNQTEAVDADTWRKLVKGANDCNPMYDLHGLAAEAGLDLRYAYALLQTFCHNSRTTH